MKNTQVTFHSLLDGVRSIQQHSWHKCELEHLKHGAMNIYNHTYKQSRKKYDSGSFWINFGGHTFSPPLCYLSPGLLK